ncbi:MEDS domain-containing protein [Planobispora longispora]|uniref:MEDS domain-containing protein n=1 Tax=Planobispora longispora TaxID=28887 RepID=UPI0019439E94|nr:MEDS domain-containing protein [Planobispora longispora]
MRQVKDVRLGDHLCLAFAHEAEQREVASAFVTAGLERGERVLYFTDGPTGDRVRRWLEESGVDVAEAMATGRLGIRSAEDTYLAAGRFDPDAMIDALREEVDRSLAAGFAGFRVSGEMGWALRGMAGAERLEEYERRVTALFDEGVSAAICLYDTRVFPADRLSALIGSHPGRVQMNALVHEGPLRVIPSFDPAGSRVLRVAGAIDHDSATAWSAALRGAIGGNGLGGDLQIDMSELEFIDVAGLRALVRTAGELEDGRRLRVTRLAPRLNEIVRLVGWDQTTGLIIDAESFPS